MDKQYTKLFTEIARSTEVLAEKAMELNHEKKDEKSESTAKTMRDDYAQLHDRMAQEDFDFNSLTKAEYAKLTVGAILAAQQIESRLKTMQTALSGYKIDVIPKLQRIINEAKTDEEAKALAEEIFQIFKETE